MLVHPMAEMGGIVNYGGSAAAMVDIVDEKTMKPNETSLGGVSGASLGKKSRGCASIAGIFILPGDAPKSNSNFLVVIPFKPAGDHTKSTYVGACACACMSTSCTGLMGRKTRLR